MVFPQSHARTICVVLFHYEMHALDVFPVMGGAYTGKFCHINGITKLLMSFNIDLWPIAQYVRLTVVGCPNHFNTKHM